MLPNICDIQPNKLNTNMKSKFFFFYGEQGTWKTTVASNFPRPLLAGFEIGYQFIDGIHAIPMSSWSDMKDLYRQLKTPAAKEKYDTIIFDTISGAYQLCYKYVLGQFGVNDPGEVPFGKGWRTIREEFSIIKEISKLGYGLVFIAHGKEQEIVDQKTKESHTKVKIDLDSSAANIVAELSDFVFYVRKEIDEDGIEKVFGYSALPNVDYLTSQHVSYLLTTTFFKEWKPQLPHVRKKVPKSLMLTYISLKKSTGQKQEMKLSA